MNKERRRQLKKTISHLDSVIDEVDFLYDEECESLDNYPENLQGCENYEKIEENCETISDAINSLQEAKDLLEELL